jgi:hypothetical protein
MGMTYTKFLAMMADEVGDSGNDENNGNYLNFAASFVWNYAEWKERRARAYVNTVLPVTTGTVDVVKDSTALIEGSGTDDWTSPSVLGYKFALNYTSTPYTIATVTDADTLVLDRAYTGASSAGTTFVMYDDVVSLASDVDTLTRVWLHDNDRAYDLPVVTEKNVEHFGHFPRQAARPWQCSLIEDGLATTRQLRVGPFAPDKVYQIEYTYLKAYSEMSSNADTTGLPATLDDAILEMALSMAYRRDHFARSTSMRQHAREMIREEWRRYSPASPKVTYLIPRSDIRPAHNYPADLNDLEI